MLCGQNEAVWCCLCGIHVHTKPDFIGMTLLSLQSWSGSGAQVWSLCKCRWSMTAMQPSAHMSLMTRAITLRLTATPWLSDQVGMRITIAEQLFCALQQAAAPKQGHLWCSAAGKLSTAVPAA